MASRCEQWGAESEERTRGHPHPGPVPRAGEGYTGTLTPTLSRKRERESFRVNLRRPVEAVTTGEEVNVYGRTG